MRFDSVAMEIASKMICCIEDACRGWYTWLRLLRPRDEFRRTRGGGRRRRIRTEGLEPRYLLNADFSFTPNGLTLDNFSEISDQNLTISEVGNQYLFTLAEGLWSGTNVPGVAGNGLNFLIVDSATVDPTSNGIDADLSAVQADVSFLNVDFGGLVGGLNITGAGNVDVPAATVMSAAELDVDAEIIFVRGSVNIVGAPGSTSTLEASNNLSVNAGNIATDSANVELLANQNGNASVDSIGIVASNGASITTSGTGDIALAGRGGDSPGNGLNLGVFLISGTTIESTAANSGGSISITGHGGQGTDLNAGILILDTGTQIRSASGDISITGVGGSGTGTANHGVAITGSATVESTGTSALSAAKIFVNGTAGSGTSQNDGVLITSAGTAINTAAGDIDIAGTQGAGAGALSNSVSLALGATLESTGAGTNAGSISLSASGGDSAVQSGILSIDGDVSITAHDDVRLSSAGQIGVSPAATTPPSFAVTMGADSDANSSGTVEIDGNITAPGGLTVGLADNNGVVDAFISDAGQVGTFTMLGPGTLALNADNTYSGQTIVDGGTLLINGSVAGGALVNNGGTLGGQENGVGSGTIAGNVIAAPGGTVAPGLSPGILNTADFTLQIASVFSVEVNGITPGTQHDQVVVTGAVSLNAAVLDVSGTIGPVAAGTEIVLIDNDDVDVVTGSFAGLPGGSNVDVNGQNFQIVYNGGDGNDVALLRGNTLANLDVLVNGSKTPVIQEGSTVQASISFTNSPQQHNVNISWGDGRFSSLAVPPGTFVVNVDHRYFDDDPSGTDADAFVVNVTVTDSSGGILNDNSVFVTVGNVAPQFQSLNLIPSVMPLGTTATLSGTYTDPGIGEEVLVDVDWDGDGTFDVQDMPVSNGVFSLDNAFDDSVGTHLIGVRLRDDDLGESFEQVFVTVTDAIRDVQLFYNNSAFDGNGAAVDAADFNAIAPDKEAITFGQLGLFDNISSYSRGINGIFIDSDLPNDGADLDAADFDLRVGNDNMPEFWAPAPAPADVGVLPNAGVDGTDRAYITFADGAIVDTWLAINILAGADTGLSVDQTFFFGSAVGETGQNVLFNRIDVDALDFLVVAVELTPTGSQGTEPIDSAADFNRDRSVDAFDFLAAAIHFGFDIVAQITPQQPSPGVAASIPIGAKDAAIRENWLAANASNEDHPSSLSDERVGGHADDGRTLAFSTLNTAADRTVFLGSRLARDVGWSVGRGV